MSLISVRNTNPKKIKYRQKSRKHAQYIKEKNERITTVQKHTNINSERLVNMTI